MKFTLLFALLPLAFAIELTPDTWDEETADKTLFVKFFAPWCGHCKKMKPDWDALMSEYEGSESVLVADVDCINSGKELCNKHGVQGFPTIKHGSGNSLQDYKGGRALDDLRKFAAGLKPPCNVHTLEHCSSEERERVEQHIGKSSEVLRELVQEYENTVADIESTFKKGVENLQATYNELQEDKTTALAELQDVGIAKALLNKQHKNEL